LIKLKQAIAIKFSICVGATSIALAGAMPARAVSFVNTYSDLQPSSNNVGPINTTNGSFTPANTYSLDLNDIAVSSTNTLYGITDDQLYTLNPGNTQTIKGNIVLDALNGPILTGMIGLAFDNTDKLYAIAGCNATKGCSDVAGGKGNPGFYSINTSNGVATLINSLGSYTPTAFSLGGDAGDIVFDPSNNKFLGVSGNANSTLFSLDLNGNITSIGNTGFANISGLAVESGILYGYTTTGQQIVINPLTGQGSNAIGLSGTKMLIGGAASLATEKITTKQVPEPSFGPGLLAVGAFLGGRYWLKRKNIKRRSNIA
jgi:hypothetical protein